MINTRVKTISGSGKDEKKMTNSDGDMYYEINVNRAALRGKGEDLVRENCSVFKMRV